MSKWNPRTSRAAIARNPSRSWRRVIRPSRLTQRELSRDADARRDRQDDRGGAVMQRHAVGCRSCTISRWALRSSGPTMSLSRLCLFRGPPLASAPVLAAAFRLPLAALMVHAGQTGRAWTLARAGFRSLSLLWSHGLAVLVADTPLVRESHRNHS